MRDAGSQGRRCILAVFSHPDDETSTCAGTFARYAREGVEIYVVTATRGELGTLGTGGLVVERDELPAVREAELRTVLQMCGVQPPILLNYRDQELVHADLEVLAARVASIMERVKPDVLITWGPTGISNHDDHVVIHRATVEAFHRYSSSADVPPRLFFVAITEEVAERFEIVLHGSEKSPTVIMDITDDKSIKLEALRTYRSQEDAQELAEMLEAGGFDEEGFHQAHPPPPDGRVSNGFWE